eukprot:343983-Chlamydomonas_euryale.AAC.1
MNSITSQVFLDAKTAFAQNPNCLPPQHAGVLSSPNMHASCHPASCLAGQFWSHILGFGPRLASLWAHPMLAVSHP